MVNPFIAHGRSRLGEAELEVLIGFSDLSDKQTCLFTPEVTSHHTSRLNSAGSYASLPLFASGGPVLRCTSSLNPREINAFSSFASWFDCTLHIIK